MKRCTNLCGKCIVSHIDNESNTFGVNRPHIKYKWCVYRHSEPLGRGEYEIIVKDNGDITGTVCYRSRVVPKTRMGRKRGSSGGVL